MNGSTGYALRKTWWLGGTLLSLNLSMVAQPVSLGIQSSNSQVNVFWPDGLSLVQPQRATNLTSWQDLGAPTTATNVAEGIGSGQTFYRLRFLKPEITTQPLSQTNSPGGSVSFNVTATGTAPLAYQWRKENTNLVGQINASLALTNVIADDAGNYSVAIANRAGSATSDVAVLTVNLAERPAGIYMGTFAGQTDNGGFGVLLRSNGLAYALGYNTPQDEGVLASGFAVAADGTFLTTTTQGGTVSGAFTPAAVSGDFTNALSQSGTFSGNRKADTGIHAADVGYYVGTFGGTFTGNGYAIIAADGAVFFFFASTTAVEGGGYGTIDAANSFSGITAPDGLQGSGTLNPTTHVLSGNYSFMGMTLGTFTLTLSLGL